MRGIEAFINLDTLVCNGNQLTRLHLSAIKALRYLNCAENQLTSLEVH